MNELDLDVLFIQMAGPYAFYLKAYLAVFLVCGTCGLVGSLVVGNRMAFFSDALAHCAFAGIALGLLAAALATGGRLDSDFVSWLVPAVMVVFGVTVGFLIAWVRETTVLTSDTVIGVFFAGAIGFGAILLPLLKRVSQQKFEPEDILFGSPTLASAADLIILAVLGLLTAGLVLRRYNEFVFGSFNPSLARSRRIQVRWHNIGFVVLLALIVFLSIRAVGALLINALLIVPAATAANLARNLRQYFWWTLGLSVGAGLAGTALSFQEIPLGNKREPLSYGPGGVIVVLSVLLFLLSLTVRRK